MFSYHIDDDTELRLPEEQDAEAYAKLFSENAVYFKPTHHTVFDTYESALAEFRERREQLVSGIGITAFIWHKQELAEQANIYFRENSQNAELAYTLGEKRVFEVH